MCGERHEARAVAEARCAGRRASSSSSQSKRKAVSTLQRDDDRVNDDALDEYGDYGGDERPRGDVELTLRLGELFGARGDGRGLDEPRRLAVQLGTARSRHVDGSCDVAQGLTRVSAHAQGPREHERRSDEKHDRCVLEVSATYAPFASVGARTGARRQDGRDLENAVRNALAPALMAERYPRALIKIHVLVTCDDGGATSAAINAAGLALVDAGIFLRGVVAAARVGAPVAATTLVDPNRAEARHGVALDLACLPCFGEVLWTDLTGERPLQPDAYDSLIARALDAAAKVGEQLATAARDHVARLDAVREASLEAAVAS